MPTTPDTSTNRPRRRTILHGGTLGLAAWGGASGLQLLTPGERALAGGKENPVSLDILFIGAHPDDEAGTLAALGQWNEATGAEVGVITVTRGEGGGNAVGLEEGPPLGLIREAEERQAVGRAGIEHVFNLDGLDFYYTASAPLSREIWGGDAVLDRIVRVVRATRPSVIVTMNPSAVEGNHGNHQQAAMFAVEAYFAAGDPERFPEHAQEGFRPWTPQRLLRTGATGEGGTGPDAVATGYRPTVASDLVFGAWDGNRSERHGERWSVVKDRSMHDYVTQGWADRPGAPSEPAKIPVTWLTVLHSRAPLVSPTTGDDAALRGAVLPIDGGLPLGTLIEVRAAAYEFVPGEKRTVTVTVTASPDADLSAGEISLTVPKGWTCTGDGAMSGLSAGESRTAEFAVTAGTGHDAGSTHQIRAQYGAGGGRGSTFAPVRVAGPLEVTIAPLEEIADFRDWTSELGMKHLDALVPELLSVPAGIPREIGLIARCFSNSPTAGEVAVTVPEGFSVSPATQQVPRTTAGATTELSVDIENTDTELPTGNQGENQGSWPVSLRTTTEAGHVDREVTMNLVPSTRIPRLEEAPTIDGTRDEASYPGDTLAVRTVWDGEPMGGEAESVGADAWVSHDGENLYLFVSVQDDVRGTILPPEDNKRQRRTDSVEISIDPRGNAANTAQTLIAGIMPSMGSMTGGPGVGRDRDNFQGEAEETAPGMEVAVSMAESEADYTGYDLEVKIPMDVLPDRIDPQRMGLEIVVNDSDTQNKAVQTRVGWSTFPGMRADPWRWGIARLEGLEDAGSDPVDPRLPDTAARSVGSPQSILQSAGDLVPLGGGARLSPQLQVGSAKWRGHRLVATVTAPAAGTLRSYVWDGKKIVAEDAQKMRRGRNTISFATEANGTHQEDSDLAVSLENEDGVSAARHRLE